MVAVPSVGKILILGIVALVGFLIFQRSQQIGIGRAATEVGEGIGSIGGGIQGFLTGIGTGSAQLLNPLFSIVELARQGGLIQGRETTERPREIVTTAAAGAARRVSVPSPGVRSASQAISEGIVSRADVDRIQGSLSRQAAFAGELQRGFDQLVARGQLAPYRGYYRDLQRYLTPEQRELL